MPDTPFARAGLTSLKQVYPGCAFQQKLVDGVTSEEDLFSSINTFCFSSFVQEVSTTRMCASVRSYMETCHLEMGPSDLGRSPCGMRSNHQKSLTNCRGKIALALRAHF